MLGSLTEYREYMEDCGAPTVLRLAERTRKSRGHRRCDFGHEMAKGEPYVEWVGLVDGDFTVQIQCLRHYYGED